MCRVVVVVVEYCNCFLLQYSLVLEVITAVNLIVKLLLFTLMLFYNICFAAAERRKKEEAEHRAKLDEIAEKQRRREQEVEEKRTSKALARYSELPVVSRPLETPATPEVAPVAPAVAAPAPGKYVPRFRQAAQAPPPEPDRWGSGRQNDQTPPPVGDRWRGGGGQRQPWTSSRTPPRGGSSS